LLLWQTSFFKAPREKNRFFSPDLIQKEVTDRALAYWYVDDGGVASLGRYALHLHTQSFLPEEARSVV
jgi:hypothetical protein